MPPVRSTVLAFALGAIWTMTAWGSGAKPPVYTTTVLSVPLQIDGIIKSMKGPLDSQRVTLMPLDQPAELAWVTGFTSQIVEADGETPANPDYMCHSNLDLKINEYKRLMYDHRRAPLNFSRTRLFTLSPGVTVARFPDGFGIPLSSHQKMLLQMQVMNHNQPDLKTQVRHKVTLSYVKDRDLEKPLVPLRVIAAEGLKALDGGSGVWNVPDGEVDEDLYGASCSLGAPVATMASSGHTKTDAIGQRYTAHWVVKPGVEVNHTNTTEMMRVEADTTLHYAIAHLHPFAVYIELNDLTEQKTVFRFDVNGLTDRIGIADMEAFSSEQGLPLYKDHQYQLVTRYDNTSGVDQDAMAALLLYVRDVGFD